MNGKVTQYKVGDRVKIIDGFHTGKQAEIIKIQNNDHIRVRYDGNLFMAGLYRSDQIAPIPPKQAETQQLAAAPEVVTFKDQSDLRSHLGLPPAKTSMPKLTAFFEAEAARQDEQIELDALRAELAAAQSRIKLLEGSLDFLTDFIGYHIQVGDIAVSHELDDELKQAHAMLSQRDGQSNPLDALRAEITKLQADVVTLTARNRQLRVAGRLLLRALDDQFGAASITQFPPGTSEYCLDEERIEAAKVFKNEVNS